MKEFSMKEDNTDGLSISDSEFEDMVLKNDKPVLLEFEAEWCGSCHIMGPVLKQALSEYDGRIRFCTINIDQNEAVAKMYGVRDVPTLLFFKNGELRDHFVGAVSKRMLSARLDALLQKI